MANNPKVKLTPSKVILPTRREQRELFDGLSGALKSVMGLCQDMMARVDGDSLQVCGLNDVYKLGLTLTAITKSVVTLDQWESYKGGAVAAAVESIQAELRQRLQSRPELLAEMLEVVAEVEHEEATKGQTALTSNLLE